MMSSNQLGWDRKYPLKEADFHAKKLPVDIGVKWKDLARELEFSQASIEIIAKENFHNAKECCIEVLVRWLRREGKDATAEKLVEALVEIGLKNVADRFPSKPSDTSQNSEAVIRDLEEKDSRQKARIKELEAVEARQKSRIKELEDEVSTLTVTIKKLEDGGEQKGEENDKSKETDQEARERLVSEILGECKKKLETYVTSPLEVREVRQNMLKLSVKVGFLKVLSEHLEEQYNTALGIAPEACQCSEDLRKRFHDFAYRVLQAENREIDHKINDLKETPNEMLKDVEEEFKHLLCLQEKRNYLLVQLEELQHLFLPAMHSATGRCWSDVTGKRPENLQRKETKWNTCPKRKKERYVTAPDHTGDEEKSHLSGDNEEENEVEGAPKRTSASKSVKELLSKFTKKGGDINMNSVVSDSSRRDS